MLLISFLYGLLFANLASYAFFNKRDFEFVFLTLFVIVSPIPLISFTSAWLVKYYLYSTFLISLIVSIYKFYKTQLVHKPLDHPYLVSKLKKYKSCLIKSINYKLFVFVGIITFVFTYKFLPPFWRFEAHDLIYFSWLNEIFAIDYEGPIRIPTAYPYLLSANHLTPGSLLTPFLMLSKNVNLFSSYSIKYFLVLATFFNFIYTFFTTAFNEIKSNKFNRFIISTFLILFLFFIYFPEIDYSIAISNYPLILLGLCLGSFILKYKNEHQLNIIFPYFIYSFLVVKATTFPIFFLTICLYCVINNFNTIKGYFLLIQKKHIFFISLMLILNLLSWIVPNSLKGGLDLTFPFCLATGINASPLSTCISSVMNNPFAGWYVSGIKVDFINYLFPSQFIMHYIYIWIICLLPCITSGFVLYKYSNSKISKHLSQFLICYGLATAICVVFLRESISLSGAHTFHSYIIAPIFTIVALVILILNNIKYIKIPKFTSYAVLPLVLALIIINNSDDSILSVRTRAINESSISSDSRISITLIESTKFNDEFCTNDLSIKKRFGLYLNSNGCAGNDLGEIKNALEGKRSNTSLNSQSSLIKTWALEKSMGNL